MPSDSYITPADYAGITGRGEEEATEARLQRASMQLDVRLGLDIHQRSAQSGELLLLDTGRLSVRDHSAVKQWVAWFVVGLAENNDSVATEQGVTLGRFSVDAREGKNELIPDQLRYADQLITNLVRRDVDQYRHRGPYDGYPTSGVIN